MLGSSFPLSMNQVASELGISSSGLSLLSTAVRQLAGKSSGYVAFSDLLSKVGVKPSATFSQDANTLAPGSCTAQVNIWNSGDITGSGVGGTALADRWSTAAAASGAGAGLYIWVGVPSGTVTGGTVGTWISLASTQSYWITQSGLGTRNTTLTVYFSRDSAGSYIIATHTIYLSCEVS